MVPVKRIARREIMEKSDDRTSERGKTTDQPSVFKRRDLLQGIAVLGSGTLVGQALGQAQSSGQTVAAQAAAKTQLSEKEILEKARERLYPTCRVCPECNGVACSGDGGGIAGAGSGMSFQN